jgi:hypothetical protein
MLQDTQVQFDPFESASNPPEQTYDLSIHDKRFTMIDMYLQPLIEINVRNTRSLEYHEIAEFGSWPKYTLPSIKALGVDNVREINGRWARITRVGINKFYDKKDPQGNLTGEKGEETTWKFVQFFNSEDECRAAYFANGGKPLEGNGRNAPQPVSDDNEKVTAAAFLKVIVTNAARGKGSYADAKAAVEQALAQYPTVNKFYTADSIETGALITEVTGHLPF